MSAPATYVVGGSRPWNRRVFADVIAGFPGTWHFIQDPEHLTPSWIDSISPRYIFFMHWSWKVPPQIIDSYECVAFHMTDVPYGRGGSPLQNLIQRGHKRTKLTALRMVEEYDAGPVYLKEDLELHGTAEEIYVRASHLSAEMMARIANEMPEPYQQEGKPTVFRRRKPEDSRIPSLESLESLYDFVRMLDAEGYPNAFLEYGGFTHEFRNAQLHPNGVVAEVTMRPQEKPRP